MKREWESLREMLGDASNGTPPKIHTVDAHDCAVVIHHIVAQGIDSEYGSLALVQIDPLTLIKNSSIAVFVSTENEGVTVLSSGSSTLVAICLGFFKEAGETFNPFLLLRFPQRQFAVWNPYSAFVFRPSSYDGTMAKFVRTQPDREKELPDSCSLRLATLEWAPATAMPETDDALQPLVLAAPRIELA